MPHNARHFTWLDQGIIAIDSIVKTIAGGHHPARAYPAVSYPNVTLTESDRAKSIALMRVNHVGEVCAQALYQGQALATNDSALAETLQAASNEERDHLAWLERRLRELSGRTSYLNPVWYAGAWSLGFAAGCLGDDWSLGFLAETEYQVTYHLESYMQKLPVEDTASYAIMQAMRDDEEAHADMAIEQGGKPLPPLAKRCMHITADIMKAIAYYC